MSKQKDLVKTAHEVLKEALPGSDRMYPRGKDLEATLKNMKEHLLTLIKIDKDNDWNWMDDVATDQGFGKEVDELKSTLRTLIERYKDTIIMVEDSMDY